jgi:hypothetical protein
MLFPDEARGWTDKQASSVHVHVLQIRRKTHNKLFSKGKVGLTFMNRRLRVALTATLCFTTVLGMCAVLEIYVSFTPFKR